MPITILIILMIASVFYLAYLVVRRFPDLKNLDINSLPEVRNQAVRSKILKQKFERQSSQMKKGIFKALSPVKSASKIFSHRLKKLVEDLEEKYSFHNDDQEDNQKTSETLLGEAEAALKNEETEIAEKKLIEILAKDRKNVKAYEFLGELYFNNKQYDQAEEVYKYLLKLHAVKDSAYDKLGRIAMKKEKFEEAEIDFLSSLDVNNKVAAYYDDLAQVYRAVKKDEQALDCYLRAVTIEPNNPKYLDQLIEYSIKIGDKGLARRTYNQLKKINPENGKLSDFEASIEKME